jgi:hypothetical protein
VIKRVALVEIEFVFHEFIPSFIPNGENGVNQSRAFGINYLGCYDDLRSHCKTAASIRFYAKRSIVSNLISPQNPAKILGLFQNEASYLSLKFPA